MHSSSARQCFFLSCLGKSKVCVISCKDTTKQKSQILPLQQRLKGSCSLLSLIYKEHSIFTLLLHYYLLEEKKEKVTSISGSNICFAVCLTKCVSNTKVLVPLHFKVYLGCEINKTKLNSTETILVISGC